MLVLGILFLVSSCGGDSFYEDDTSASYDPAITRTSMASAPPMAAPMPMVEEYAEEGFGYADDGADYDYGAQKVGGMRGAGIGNVALQSAGDENSANAVSDRKIRRTAYATIQISKDNVYPALTSLQSFITQQNGFVLSSNEYKQRINGEDYLTIDTGFRIPVEKYEESISFLRTLGTVQSLSSNAQDITQQYQDIEAYIKSYEKEKERIEILLQRANNISDIIVIEEKLTQIQRAIDNYKRQLINMDRETDYSFVQVSLQEERDISEVKRYISPFSDFLRLFSQSFDAFLKFFVIILGFVLPIGVIVFFIVWSILKARKNKIKRK